MLEIRLAQKEDSEAATKIIHAAFSFWTEITGYEPLALSTDYGVFIEREHVYLALENGDLLAVLALWEKDNALYIDTIAVNPDVQNRGIGRQLFDFAEALARQKNLNKLSLYTNAKMESNRAYYQKLGYEEIRIDTFDDGRLAVWMEKSIEDSSS